jgi:hypothetical protein
MRVFGEKARPRALIWGFDDETAEEIAEVFPTWRRVSFPQEVRQEEWDVLITDQSLSGCSEELYGVGFGCESFGSLVMNAEGNRVWYEVEYRGVTLASHFAIPSTLDPAISALVQRELLPLVQGKQGNPILQVRRYAAKPAPAQREGSFHPLLVTAEPEALAASFRRHTGAQIWCLPEGVGDPKPWVRLAISTWHRQDQAKFPIDPLWRDNPEWLTLDEQEIVDAIERLSNERQQVLMTLRTERRACAIVFQHLPGRLMKAFGGFLRLKGTRWSKRFNRHCSMIWDSW